MAIVSGNAPWYEKSGMIHIPAIEPYRYGTEGIGAYIPFGFSFPIGGYSVTGLWYDWDSISFYVDNAPITLDGSAKSLYFDLIHNSFGYGYVGEQVYYENGSNYLRIRTYVHMNDGRYKDTEYVFFSNGNIQIKSSSNCSGSKATTYNGYTVLGYIAGTSSAPQVTTLVNDSTIMTSGESILIERVSSTNYTVHHNSYWENDSTYTLPLKSRILSEILLFKPQTSNNNTYAPSTGRTYSIPVFIPSVCDSPFRIRTPSGTGCIRTQTPVTPDTLNPPAYIQIGGSKSQLSLGYSDTLNYVYRTVSSSWGTSDGNLMAKNNSNYWWIDPTYRRFENPITGVYSFIIRIGIEDTSLITDTAYIYYSASNSDNQPISKFYFLDSIKLSGYSGKHTTVELSLTNKTVGAIMVVSGITGSGAEDMVEFDSTIACKVESYTKLI